MRGATNIAPIMTAGLLSINPKAAKAVEKDVKATKSKLHFELTSTFSNIVTLD